MYYDADFIRTLEYGLPLTAGCGIGIDRFVGALVTALTIRSMQRASLQCVQKLIRQKS